jgi:RimJ/RimL family protein N-acetyltransferase
MSIHYRKLLPKDAKEYRKIRLECLEKYPYNFGSTFQEERNRPKLAFEEYIEQQANGKFFTGAFNDDELIGICGFSQEPRPKTRHIGTIIQMYVREEYGGKGIGLELLKMAIQEGFKIPEIEQLLLGVVATNTSANRIYEQAGFQQYGLLKNYFKAGNAYSDQRLMVLYRK